MTAYVLSEVESLDDAAFAEYARLAALSIAEYDGRYLVRSAKPEIAEGEATNQRFVLVEFPSMKQFKAWYASPVYEKALEFRGRALDRRLIFLEGLVSQASASIAGQSRQHDDVESFNAKAARFTRDPSSGLRPPSPTRGERKTIICCDM